MKQTLTMPKVGESVTEGTILRWLKSDGDEVKVDEALIEVETEKVNVEIPSPWAGVLHIAAQEGETVEVGQPLAYIEARDSVPAGAPQAQAEARPASPRAERPADVARPQVNGHGAASTEAPRYSPVVQILARERGIDLTQVPGTGHDGRVTRKDVLAYISTRERRAESAQPPTEAPVAAETVRPLEREQPATEVLPLSATRRKIAERMTLSVQTIPHAWLLVEVDVTRLVRWRQKVRDDFRSREGVELTYLPFAVQAAVQALKEHRVLNSTWSNEGIVLKKEVNIGLAVATDEGLVVPVIKSTDDLSIAGLARKIADLTERARSRRLRIEDVEGGTFTVDNTGPLGSIMSMPIINPPQAAILTLEAIVPRPVVVDDAIAIRHMVNMCLSFDHRIIDGAQAGAFLASVKRHLEAYGPETAL